MTTRTPDCDYIVIGAGSAGSVLAARLSEDRDATVTVLEAGPRDHNPFIHMPAGFMKTFKDIGVNWCLETEPSEGSGGRRVFYPRGKVIGGSGSINGHLYVRGQHRDFDVWAQLGNRGWSFQDVLPYFRKSETGPAGGDDFRGGDGPWHISHVHEKHPLCEAFIEGAVGLGIPLNPDYNGAEQEGVCYYQRSIKNGRRFSTARAFLVPAMKRPNLRVETDARVTRILFEGRRAVGIAWERHGIPFETRARREIVLAAGAVHSPHLLQVSGIGPGGLLRSLGIDVRHELPGVGENFRDHYQARVAARVKGITTLNERARGLRLVGEVVRWAATGGGLLAFSPAHVGVFTRSRPKLDVPDIQLTFTPASYVQGQVGVLEKEPAMTCGIWQMRPKSQGYIRATSPDPRDAPAIQPNYLADPGDRDALIEGLKLARRLTQTKSLAPYYAAETFPGPQVQSDDEWLDFVQRYATTVFHAMGSCKMGVDPLAVVDPDLRVHGIEGLRVADASVMPTMVSANTNAATVMIAEKAADLIRTEARGSARPAA